MNRLFLAVAIAASLLVAGCDESDDYSYHSENCASVDYGEGEEYELCCTLRCHGDYDYDNAHESCTEEYTCTSSNGDPSPHDVIDSNWYPECIY
jgi:hypothetical protein